MSTDFDRPFSIQLQQSAEILLSRYDHHIVRRLSALEGQFADPQAYQARLALEDPILYEVYEMKRPEAAGELLFGLSIVHPGRIGSEYYMTKGHFHQQVETAEVYHCLRGEGYMVMETPTGDWATERLSPDVLLYVPPRWAHRSVNTHPFEDLVTFYVYPGNAGHDYGSIEKQGFRKLVVERDGVPTLVDNPRWLPPEER